MLNSRSWNNEVFFRFSPVSVSREFGIKLSELEDYQVFAVSTRKLDSVGIKSVGGFNVYPLYLKQVNSVLRKTGSPLLDNFWKESPFPHTRGKSLDLRNPNIMAILNMTPDSFYPGSRYKDDGLETKLSEFKREGVDIVDIGGQSTRPKSDRISHHEEMRRIRKAIELALDLKFTVSVDTYDVYVAKESLEMGVDLINDVTGMDNIEMGKLAKTFDVPLVVMHRKGDFKTMQVLPSYENTALEILAFFYDKIRLARKIGIEDNIILDPGIGFGKRVEDNIKIINNLRDFRLGHPLLLGLSRKSFIGKIMDEKVEDRGLSSVILNVLAAERGVNILRVHDSEENMKLIKLIRKLNEF